MEKLDDGIDDNDTEWNRKKPNPETNVLFFAKYLAGNEIKRNHEPHTCNGKLDRDQRHGAR